MIRKGVLLAGGAGSRLHPLTRVTNKHLVGVGREPMIHWPLSRLFHAGVNDLLIVTGREHAGAVFELLGSGVDYGASFTFRVQDGATGIASALSLARDFVAGEPFVAVLGDNVFSADIAPDLRWFYETVFLDGRGPRGMVWLKQVADPQRFGVAEFAGPGDRTDQPRLVRIHEKPATPPSRYAVTGIYAYAGGPELFNAIGDLRPSARGELEITDLNNALLARHALAWRELAGDWSDAGTFPSLARAAEIVKDAAAFA